MSTAADNVIAIHGVPRSGTTWLGQLFNSSPHVAYRYQPLFSYAFRDRIDANSDIPVLREFFQDLLASDDDFVLQTGSGRLAAATPVFVKTGISHLAYKEVRFHHMLPHLLATLPELKAIGIVRDPRAVLASWFNAPREFRPEWSPDAEWREARLKNAGLAENWYGYERWKQLAQLFLQLADRYPEKFRLVSYETLAAKTETLVGQLFNFCGQPLTPQTSRFIEESTSRDDGDPYGVFRSHGNRSIPNLPAAISHEIEQDLAGTSLSRFLSRSRFT